MYSLIEKVAALYARAALMSPPPVLTKQITEWASKMYLSHMLFMLQNMGKNIRQLKYGNIVADTPADITREDADSLEVPFDTTGWQYASVLERFEHFPTPMARREVLVLIKPATTPRAALGHWYTGAYIMSICHPIPTEEEVSQLQENIDKPPVFLTRLMYGIQRTVQHELIHAAQTYVTDAMAEFGPMEKELQAYKETGKWSDVEIPMELPPEKFGLPPRKTRSKREPGGYAVSPITKKRLSKKKLVHQLRDIEFYPSLLDEFSKFKRHVAGHSLYFAKSGYPIEKAIKIFVGAQKQLKRDQFFLPPSTFFVKLRRYNVPKWRKAVKEFIKAVMNDPDTMFNIAPAGQHWLYKLLDEMYKNE